MGLNKGLMTSASDRWFTPPDLLSEVRAFLGADCFDPCPARDEGEAIESGLWQSWKGRRCFVNPPYGRAIGPWVRKCTTEPAREVILLVPSRTGAGWFQALYDHPICFMRGRLHFSGAESGAPFDSALVYIGYRPRKFAQAFAHRGVTVRRVVTHGRHIGLWEVA